MLGAAACASAQIPDVRIRVDATLSARTEEHGPDSVHYYSTMGRPSTIALTFTLEPGFRAYVAERLEKIPGDPEDLLDEIYVEDEGIWRVGKQYLPFGSGQILHESVPAARGDTNLIFEGLPLALALCDGGPNYQRGFVGRLGSRIGLSLAVGHHFGIAGTALTQIRYPELAPGPGRGWQQAIGADASKTFGTLVLRAEGVAFRNGETGLDRDLNLLDLTATYAPEKDQSLYLGWTRADDGFGTFVRVGASLSMDRLVSFEPMVRYRDGQFLDLSMSVRVRF